MASKINLHIYDSDKSFCVDSSTMSIYDLQKCYKSASGISIKSGIWKYNNSDISKQWYTIKIIRGKEHKLVSRDKIEQNESIILENGDIISMYLVHD